MQYHVRNYVGILGDMKVSSELDYQRNVLDWSRILDYLAPNILSRKAYTPFFALKRGCKKTSLFKSLGSFAQ
jgi:hypothetical protein